MMETKGSGYAAGQTHLGLVCADIWTGAQADEFSRPIGDRDFGHLVCQMQSRWVGVRATYLPLI